LDDRDDVRKPLAERLALLGQGDSFGVGQPPMGCVSVKQGSVDTVFLEDKLEFLEQQGFNLAGSPS